MENTLEWGVHSREEGKAREGGRRKNSSAIKGWTLSGRWGGNGNKDSSKGGDQKGRERKSTQERFGGIKKEYE